MKIAGEHHLAFARRDVWAALMDPAVLAGTLPGCEALERVGEDTLAGRLRVDVGPVRGDFRGRLTLGDLAPPESYRLKLDGRGPSGFLSGEGTVRLEATAAGGTTLRYDLDAQVGGRIAGLGQRLLESSGKAVALQGLQGLERQLAALHGGEAAEGEEGPGGEGGERGSAAGGGAAAAGNGEADAPGAGGAVRRPAASPAAAPVAPPAAPPAEPPSQAAFAAGVARQMLRDLVPPEQRRFLLAGGCFLGGLLLGFWMGGRRR